MHFMRHGQSVFNEAYDRMGRDPKLPDARLSAYGQAQVVQAARKLAHGQFTHVVSSPYTRAIETACIVASELGATHEVEFLLGERRLYSCDIGTPTDLLKETWPHLSFETLPSEEWWLPFNESDASLRARIKAFHAKWQTNEKWGKTLFVSHWYFILAATGKDANNAEIITLHAR